MGPNRRGQMRLAGARAANQLHVVHRVKELDAMQLFDQGFVGGAASKVKAGQITVCFDGTPSSSASPTVANTGCSSCNNAKARITTIARLSRRCLSNSDYNW